jgi:hypothetical protein
MRPVSLAAAVVVVLLLAPAAWAQQSGKHSKAKPAAAAKEEGPGTTIIGDHESPIGLYLTPWKNEYAERGMDRPARFVEEEPAPLDPGSFHRQIEYYDTITAYRQNELGTKSPSGNK